jgi:ribosomal-protein-alanine N-acetyltransferase
MLFERLLTFFFSERQRQSHATLSTRLEGAKVYLRAADLDDWKEWTQLRHVSEAFLQPWEPEWPKDCATRNFYINHWRRLMRRWAQDREYSFLVFEKTTNALVGGVTISEIRRNSTHAGVLGYWMGMPYTGKGYMGEAAKLLCDFAFTSLNLTRIEASCMPDNEPSLRLLRRLGMKKIGLAHKYMMIGGKWRDHYLFEYVK